MSSRSLSSLSDNALVSHLNHLVQTERTRLVEILEHLNEVERRNLHRARGYASLFEYCVSGLRYSHSAAGRRIAAARALRRFPEVAPLLESGELSLVTLSMTAGLLTPGNRDKLLARIRGRSQREVERLIAAYRPETRTRDRVQGVCVRERVAPEADGQQNVTDVEPSLAMNSTPSAGSAHGADAAGAANGEGVGTEPTPAGAADEATTSPSGSVRATRVVHKHKIQFIAGDNFMEKIQAMRALLSHRMPEATFEQVFDAAMEAYLDAHCPVRRKQRREQRQSRRANGMNCRPEDKSLPALGVDKRHTSRHIPTAVRDAVFARDRGRCTFVGDSGRRCTATRYLEMDHIEPFARGGTHDPSNLRLLCRAHNHLAAESIYGRDKMALYSRRERNIAPMRRE